ncbi:bifunctional diguanylate cyclase/phosphodiesterase [Metabacillus sp. HB246100]
MFNMPNVSVVNVLEGEYASSIVLMSVVIACCASYVALSLNQRIQQNSFFHRYFWLSLASIAMGLGIWSMHFVGMSAFMLPLSMEYDFFLTGISILPAIFASFLAFYIANRTNTSHWPYLVSGISMGLGISSMHYVGMAAMKMDASYVYKPVIFTISVLIAITVSYVALSIFSNSKRFVDTQLKKLITSIIMGLGISSMHYTGMKAVVFYVDKSAGHELNHIHQMDVSHLIKFVAVGITLLLLISGLASILDRYVEYRMNYFDALTQLPNQRQFESLLNKNMNLRGTLAIIEIHQLEKWISTHGYSIGDDIVQTVKRIIEEQKSPSTTIYRIEGNRLAIMDGDDQSGKRMKASLNEISAALKKPLKREDHILTIDHICVYSSSNKEKGMKELFANTLAVLQHPSALMDSGVIEYDPSVHTFNLERQVVLDIERAMDQHELFLVYQPKVCSKTYDVSGVEALLRWKHPEQGMISPGVFIPILESNGKIFDVTDWVIREVSKQISIWKREGRPFAKVSINIPGPYITSERLMSVLKENIRDHNIDSRSLELEITETSVIDNIENAIKAVGEYRKLGLSVALDDFGTGLSSLSYLKRIPVTTIKIDKSFVDDVPDSEKDSAVLKAIITLCSSLNMKVVIEGVETKQQFDFIKSVTETPHIQGYYFSKPLEAQELTEWWLALPGKSCTTDEGIVSQV